MFPWAEPVALVNARVLTAEGLAPTLRFGSRILSVSAHAIACSPIAEPGVECLS